MGVQFSGLKDYQHLHRAAFSTPEKSLTRWAIDKIDWYHQNDTTGAGIFINSSPPDFQGDTSP